MSTQPRMSAPIGRLQMKTSEARNRRASGLGRWSAAEPPVEAEASESEEASLESTHPPFYPFPLRRSDIDDR